MKVIRVYWQIILKVRYLIILSVSLQCQSLLFSQSSKARIIEYYPKYYKEGLLIRTDRDLYISGEKVWLKIYKLNGLTGIAENLSKIVYVEAMDADHNPFVQMKVNIDGYSGSASFKLPDTLRTGNYMIRSYTNWMRNFSEYLYSRKTISVINPFRLNDIKISSSHVLTDKFQQNDSPSDQLQIEAKKDKGIIPSLRNYMETAADGVYYKIECQKSSYSPREKILIGILATDSSGNPLVSDFSLSVAKAVTIYEKRSWDRNFTWFPDTLSDNSINSNPDSFAFFMPRDLRAIGDLNELPGARAFIPELEGHLISGRIKDRITGEPLRNQNISLSFVGKSALCQFTKTNEEGVFHFNTSESGILEIVVQTIPGIFKEYYVELDSPFTTESKKYKLGDFIIDTSRLVQINNLIICTQINNMYEPYIQKIYKEKSIRDKNDFFGKPENTILLSKYIEFASLGEAIKEIIPGVNVVKKDGKVNFKLFYPYQSQPYGNNPLVLVDGVPVYDFEKVLSIKPRDLEKVDVFITRYYISDIALDGILHFVSKKGNLGMIDLGESVYRLEYEFPQDPEIFYSPDYSNPALLNSHIPDFRNTLYWNPGLQTDNNGKAFAEFYSSDEYGEYFVIVEGMTVDGRKGSERISFNITGIIDTGEAPGKKLY